MKPIYKFILHVVHNWTNELNEAYNEGTVRKFMEKFREEADDLNINISDDQLKKYIERFDVLKNSPKITEKDLSKWTLSKLIKLVTSSEGADVRDEEDKTPDVVYQNNGITIWNGAKEDNCVIYGRGERWCITRGSWGSYRYGSRFTTFYLAKNSNLPDSDPTSFVVIHVDENGDYGISLRPNSGDKTRLSWDQMISYAPWLKDIPNLRNILKYIPLSNTEKVAKKYNNTEISVREWNNFPFDLKKQYLVARSNQSLFSDITNEEFVEKYLPKYSQIANFISITPGIIRATTLLKYLEKFNNQDRKSIVANLRPVDLKFLKSDYISFDVKQLLTILNKWDIKGNQRIYSTEDKSTIVLLNIGSDDIQMGVYQEEDDFPNVKLNKRTGKYLSEYKELDKIPFKNLIKLMSDEVLDKNIINKIINDAKTNEDSAIKIKQFGEYEILLDSNSLSSYKIQNGKITKIPFTDENVQSLLVDQKNNEGFQENIVNIIKNSISKQEDLSPTLDKDAIVSIIKATPYNKRLTTEGIIIVPEGEGIKDHTFIIKDNKTDFNFRAIGNPEEWNVYEYGNYNNYLDVADWRGYFAYLRATNQSYSDTELINLLKLNTFGNTNNNKKAFIEANPPLLDTGRYGVAIQNNTSYIINKQNPRESFRISDNRFGKLIKANIPSATARQLLGQAAGQVAGQPAAALGAGQAVAAPLRRRGRPAGVPNAAPAAAPAAPAAGNVNVPQRFQQAGLQAGYNALTPATRRRIGVENGRAVQPAGDRGAARRNNLLGAAGSVTSVIEAGPSTVYFIVLANNTVIASVVVQPGNSHFVVTANNAFRLDSPANLLQALQQRNLAEIRQYLTREYIERNPNHLEEVRGLLQQYVAENRNK